jgi:dopamine beta-monooxygenase
MMATLSRMAGRAMGVRPPLVLFVIAQLFLVGAFPSFSEKIPNGISSRMAAAVGHINPAGSGARNQFGQDFQAAGNTWTVALCQKDSDGDGVTNGAELGDPDCTWKEGDPQPSCAVPSHPGLAIAGQSAPCGDGSVTVMEVAADNTATLLLIHGLVMLLAWVVMMGIGTMAAIYGEPGFHRGPLHFKVHWMSMAGGLCLAWIAAILAIAALASSGSKMDTAHGLCGIGVMILGTLQAANSRMRGPKAVKADGTNGYAPLRSWRGLHVNFGRLIVPCAFFVAMMGAFSYKTKYEVEQTMTVPILTSVLIFLSLLGMTVAWFLNGASGLRGTVQVEAAMNSGGQEDQEAPVGKQTN